MHFLLGLSKTQLVSLKIDFSYIVELLRELITWRVLKPGCSIRFAEQIFSPAKE